MKRVLVLAIILLLPKVIYCQKIKYPVSDIPDSLMRNAKAVVRDYSLKFNLYKDHHNTEEILKATTILDKTGDKYSKEVFHYDKDNTIIYVQAKIYNKDGELFKTINRKDFKDFSYDPYGTTYSDSRYLSFSGVSNTYPYTIEYKVQYSSNVSYSFTSWYPVEKYALSIQYSSFEIEVPNEYKPQIKEELLSQEGKIIKDNNRTVYKWELENYNAVEKELYAPPLNTRTPHVITSPSEFTYDNYWGKADNWKEYGKFRNKLLDGLDELSDETKLKVKEITANLNNDLEKAKSLYTYMQSNTRYVNIDEGIGGIQPFPATDVAKYGYGDCKALTNYMMALLKVAGIKSYYSVVKAGKYLYDVDTSIVRHFSNHVILCLPFKNNTVWLECTDQVIPFGFLGSFCDDRYALVITENGGVLKKTTKYEKDDNVKITKAQVFINSTGKGEAKINVVYAGLEYDAVLDLLNSDYDSQKDYLYNRHIDIPDFKILSFNYENKKDLNPVANEYLELELTNYGSKSGNRLFVPLNLMNRFDDTPKKDSERINPIHIAQEFVHYDTITYEIPDGYDIEHLPEGETITSDFGYLSYEVSRDNNQITYSRKFEIYRDEYPKEKYDEFVDFCRQIRKADKQKMVLINTNL